MTGQTPEKCARIALPMVCIISEGGGSSRIYMIITFVNIITDIFGEHSNPIIMDSRHGCIYLVIDLMILEKIEKLVIKRQVFPDFFVTFYPEIIYWFILGNYTPLKTHLRLWAE